MTTKVTLYYGTKTSQKEINMPTIEPKNTLYKRIINRVLRARKKRCDNRGK